MSRKYPYLKSVLITLLLLCFPIAAGVVTAVGALTGPAALLTQTAAFAIAFVLGLLIAGRLDGGVRGTGLCRPSVARPASYLFFLPLLAVEMLPYFCGLKEDLSPQLTASYFIFALLTGFTEELYFRGIILNLLRAKDWRLIVLVSSLLFSLGHLANLMSGKDLRATGLQVAFALLFAFTAALLALATGSFLISAVWHFIHNFSALITASDEGPLSLVALGLQGLILLIYVVYLWQKKPGALSRA